MTVFVNTRELLQEYHKAPSWDLSFSYFLNDLFLATDKSILCNYADDNAREIRWPPLLPCYPVNCQCLWKKTLIEKKWLIFLYANINPFVPNTPFLYPLKTSENLTVFWCIHGVEKGCIGYKWIKKKERITPFPDVVLVSLLSTLNRLHSLLRCFHYCKFEQGNAGGLLSSI